MKKKLKGFTLIEMIMVLALFSIIMYSCLELIGPVSNYFVRSANFESNTACIDNIKRAIEGNLKYADRVRACYGFKPYGGSGEDGEAEPDDVTAPSSDLEARFTSFFNEFFENRRATDSAGYIYALVLDNTSLSATSVLDETNGNFYDSVDGYDNLTDFINDKKNGGRIIRYKFWYNTYDENYDQADEVLATIQPGFTYTPAPRIEGSTFMADKTPTPGVEEWYVNPKLYNSYEYRYDLGMVEQAKASGTGELLYYDPPFNTMPKMEVVSGDDKFRPSDFTITITASELRSRAITNGGSNKTILMRNRGTGSVTSSFSMKNVLDSASGYGLPSYDDVLRIPSGALDETATDFVYEVTKVERYSKMILNDEDDYTKRFDGMYFIYTVPETCYTNGAYWKNQMDID